jgi:hypothetical protein
MIRHSQIFPDIRFRIVSPLGSIITYLDHANLAMLHAGRHENTDLITVEGISYIAPSEVFIFGSDLVACNHLVLCPAGGGGITPILAQIEALRTRAVTRRRPGPCRRQACTMSSPSDLLSSPSPTEHFGTVIFHHIQLLCQVGFRPSRPSARVSPRRTSFMDQ